MFKNDESVGYRQVRLNTMGEIEVKSKSLFRGYWRQPGKTKQDFTEDGFFVTGDVGKVDGDGNNI